MVLHTATLTITVDLTMEMVKITAQMKLLLVQLSGVRGTVVSWDSQTGQIVW